MESKKKLWRGFALFMAVMLIMTYVSRMIYVSRMPRVRWSNPTAASIRSTLKTEGTVEVVNSQAVIGLEGLLVKKVCVAAGDRIETGTVLYEVDTEDMLAQLAELEAQEQAWQKQEQAARRDAATNTTRAQEDYDTTVIELDRKIAEETKKLEELMEDLDTHMFRIPEEDASDEIWIAWADERLRFDREIAEKKREIEDIQLEKEKILRQADRSIEDARRAQSAAESGLDLGAAGVSQVRERQERIALLTELSKNEGRVAAECAGDVLEVMMQSGMRMGQEAVLRYADDNGSRIFRTVISQEQKAMVHTGDTVHLAFPGSAEEVGETIDSIVQENGSYTVTVRLEPGVARGRTEGVMELVSTSEIYDFVVPVKALHNDGGNAIYVLEEKEGILGTELSVRSMTVRLLNKNEDYAAVADELLSRDMKVVTECDKELENGIAVKEWEE
ncbi:MAG: biotin/lipoyl-binding protein [Lachnospiraceae bacterium]|nr:biotin/lipoyl-binding protein [Lachnospiraceae bacterium]